MSRPLGEQCRFTGLHRMELRVVERCRCCGHERDRGRTSRLGVGCLQVSLWALLGVLLLLAFT